MKVPAKWQPILMACAQAHKQDIKITPRQWLSENHPELRWRTAERILSIPKLEAYLLGDLTEQSPAMNNKKQPSPHSPKQFKKKCGRVGAPYGNRNAMKHGVYSKFLTDEEEKMREEILGIEHVKHELALVRVLLARALRKQPKIKQARENELQNGKPSLCAMSITEYELRNEIGERRSERTKWVLLDIDVVIDRLLRRIAQLTTISNQIAQMPELTGVEQLAFIHSVLIHLQNGELTALEAGIKLESQLIPLPTTLAMKIQAELTIGNNLEIDTGGVTGEQVKQRSAQLRTETGQDHYRR